MKNILLLLFLLLSSCAFCQSPKPIAVFNMENTGNIIADDWGNSWGDGSFVTMERQGIKGLASDPNVPTSNYIYFKIDDSIKSQIASNIYVVIEYFRDKDVKSLPVEYNTTKKPYHFTDESTPTYYNTDIWNKAQCKFSDFLPKGMMNHGNDFRINIDKNMLVRSIEIYNEKPEKDYNKEMKEAALKKFITFKVPGYENQMRQIQAIYYEAYMNPTNIPGPSFMDLWAPTANLSANGSKDFKNLYFDKFQTRKIDAEGYVSSEQHYSHAKDDGWPFPVFWNSWAITGTVKDTCGYIFTNDPNNVHIFSHGYAPELLRLGHMGDKAIDKWEWQDMSSQGINGATWNVTTTGDNPSITTKDGLLIDTYSCPFMQIRIGNDSPKELSGSIQWLREEDNDFSDEREIKFSFDMENPFKFPDPNINHCEVDMTKNKFWTGKVKKIRYNFQKSEFGINYKIDSIFSAMDTRHQMNAFNYILGAIATFNTTGDIDFLKNVLSKLRKVMTYAYEQYYNEDLGIVQIKIQGHDGLPGIITNPDGTKKHVAGQSIGGNYWDILPCGNFETYTGYYFYYTLNQMAELEEFISSHPELNITSSEKAFTPSFMKETAETLRKNINSRLWNEKSKRYYIAEDINGDKWDYGYILVNQEAIYYGLADDEKARQIMDWVDGRRIIEGDTSQGADIYRWQLAPRASTKRNENYYFWAWDPQVFPFGWQVQDGGAVFAQSFNDLMSRIKVYGADNAWNRLQGILDWYTEVEKAGGYRAYYEKVEHGTRMQGSGDGGGIGIDMEFEIGRASCRERV